VTVIDDNAATTDSAVGAGAAPTLTDTAKAPASPTPSGPSGGGGEPAPAPDKKTYTDEEAIACSLENPESCEACD